MSKNLDLTIYNVLSHRIKASEIYLGFLPFEFHFTKAVFKATCTEAFPFNAFDKVICKLLEVEEHLSLEEMGEILGMNVSSDEESGRKVDLAEREILVEAVQSLASEEFGKMLEVGDTQMSKCYLTPTGKEYAAQQSKFRTTKNKPFSIIFDHTTGNHKDARKHFEYIEGARSEVEYDIADLSEAKIKEIAAVQVPEIYNLEKQYSFTNPRLSRKETYTVNFPVAITYDLRQGHLLCYCFNDQKNEIHEFFSGWIEGNDSLKTELTSQIREKFSGNATVSDSPKLPPLFKVLSEMPADATVNKLSQDLAQKKFVDEMLFYNCMHKVFEDEEGILEMYISLTFFNHILDEQLKRIIEDLATEESRVFLVLPTQIAEASQDLVKQWTSLASESPNLYVMEKPVKRFWLGSKTSAGEVDFQCTDFCLSDYEVSFVKREKWNELSEKKRNHILSSFSKDQALDLCYRARNRMDDLLKMEVTRDNLEELQYFELKLQPFSTHGEDSNTVKATLDLLNEFKSSIISQHEEKVQGTLQEAEKLLVESSSVKELHAAKEKLTELTTKFLFPENTWSNKIEALLTKLEARAKEVDEASKVHNFILDTNILLKEPEVIALMRKKNRLVIAAKVLDELDRFKNDNKLKSAATKSISLIHDDPNKVVVRSRARIDLLPADFSPKSPDNLILSTAMAYAKENGILVTEDKGLQEKAKMVDVRTLSLSSFKKLYCRTKK